MTESKKEWVAPELIVLVRSKPEEAVLGACKDGGVGGGPGNANNWCAPVENCQGFCDAYSQT